MKTAKIIPIPATVTSPPFCDRISAAAFVVALTVPPVDVDVAAFEEPAAVAELVAFPLAVALPVPLAFPADVTVEFEEAFDAFVPAPVDVPVAAEADLSAFVLVED
jgi:hypothetical protein